MADVNYIQIRVSSSRSTVCKAQLTSDSLGVRLQQRQVCLPRKMSLAVARTAARLFMGLTVLRLRARPCKPLAGRSSAAMCGVASGANSLHGSCRRRSACAIPAAGRCGAAIRLRGAQIRPSLPSPFLWVYIARQAAPFVLFHPSSITAGRADAALLRGCAVTAARWVAPDISPVATASLPGCPQDSTCRQVRQALACSCDFCRYLQ